MRTSLVPHPLWSAALALFWLWLNNSLAPGHVVVGLLLGWGLPLFARRFWPQQERVDRPWRLLSFVGVVLVIGANDIVNPLAGAFLPWDDRAPLGQDREDEARIADIPELLSPPTEPHVAHISAQTGKFTAQRNRPPTRGTNARIQ